MSVIAPMISKFVFRRWSLVAATSPYMFVSDGSREQETTIGGSLSHWPA